MCKQKNITMKDTIDIIVSWYIYYVLSIYDRYIFNIKYIFFILMQTYTEESWICTSSKILFEVSKSIGFIFSNSSWMSSSSKDIFESVNL